MTSFAAKYYRDYSPLAVHGPVHNSHATRKQPKKTDDKSTPVKGSADLEQAHGKQSARPTESQQGQAKKSSLQV